MRTFLSGVSVLLCGLLLIGAVNAPVMQSQSFYINDHASVISQENRDSMLKAAQELYNETGVRAVLLTMEGLDGRTPEEYAEDVYKAWELGVEGAALLLLLSTEEKRFAIYSNTDISVSDTLTSSDVLAAEEKFDLAANNCFIYIIYSIRNMYLTDGEIITKSGDITRVPDKSSVVGDKGTETIYETEAARNTSVTEITRIAPVNGREVGKTAIALALFLCAFIMLSQTAKASRKNRSKARKLQEIYNYRRIYSPDEPITARIDDLDYPSGFGGLGNRKAIYMEDVNDADDIGIIKRNYDNASGVETSGGHNTAN